MVMKMTVTTIAWTVPHHSMMPCLMTLCTFKIHPHAGSFQMLLTSQLTKLNNGRDMLYTRKFEEQLLDTRSSEEE